MPEAGARHAVVIGAGPAGLMAAEVLAQGGADVTVYDRMPSIGRKLLMAGLSGLNITHAEPLPAFLQRYGDADPRLPAAVTAFSPETLRDWCQDLGQPTFVGSSRRVFPVSMKASPLLRAWRQRLVNQRVRFALRHRWTGWDAEGRLVFTTPEGEQIIAADVTVLALGGASWPRLGSDGAWAATLAASGATLTPFAPANCGFAVPWSPIFVERHEGAPLKAVKLRFGPHQARGDLVVTRDGLEGGALYALAKPLREALAGGLPVDLQIALRPDLTEAQLTERLARRKPKDSLATALRRTVALAPVAIGLLQEAARRDAGPPLASLDARALAGRINAVPVRLTAPASLDRAISTAGGLAFSSCDPGLMLQDRPGTFVAGEMLDWEAPTGGYLLQACFATGHAAGTAACDWVSRS